MRNSLRKLIIIIDIIIIGCYIFSKTPSIQQEMEKYTFDSETNTAYVDITFVKENPQLDPGPFYAALNKVPTNILTSFNEDSWAIFLDDSIIDAGYTDYDNHYIYVNPSIKGLETSTLLHEFGHYLDYKMDFQSKEEPFITLYNTYAKDYVEFEYLNVQDKYEGTKEFTYSSFNEREFFAITFKDYILNNTYVKDTYPEIYSYYKKIL